MVKDYDKKATKELCQLAWKKTFIFGLEKNDDKQTPTSKCIQALINKGANVNAKPFGDDFDTVLGLAVIHGKRQDSKLRSEIVSTLLENGADPNILGYDNKTPLMWACYTTCDVDVIKALLDHKANVNAKDPDGLTPLMCAVLCNTTEKKKIQVVNMLLEKGASVFSKDNDGNTAIHYADSLPVLKILLQAEMKQDKTKRVRKNFAAQRKIHNIKKER